MKKKITNAVVFIVMMTMWLEGIATGYILRMNTEDNKD